MEKWRPLLGYEGFYDISNHGRVRSLKRTGTGCSRTGRIMKSNDYGKYPLITLCTGGEKKTFLVHRLVAENWVENPNKFPQVNHKNGIKNDNRVENLEWCTPSDNIRHSYKIGLSKVYFGEHCSSAKLTKNDVLLIRERFKSGETVNEIFKDYSHIISYREAIRKIVLRQRWTHI